MAKRRAVVAAYSFMVGNRSSLLGYLLCNFLDLLNCEIYERMLVPSELRADVGIPSGGTRQSSDVAAALCVVAVRRGRAPRKSFATEQTHGVVAQRLE